MIQTLAIILLLLWLLGFSFNVAGGVIHVLLIVAVVMLLAKMLDRVG